MDLPEDWTPAHSLAVLLVGAAAADGDYAPVERDEMLRALDAILGDTPDEVLAAAEAHLQDVARLEGPEAWTDAVARHASLLGQQLDEGQRKAALAALTAVTRADGRVLPWEHALWLDVSRRLGFGP